jgi:hypothetical protein
MTELEQLVLDAYKQGLVDAQETIAATFEVLGKPDTNEAKVLTEIAGIIRKFDLLQGKDEAPQHLLETPNGE